MKVLFSLLLVISMAFATTSISNCSNLSTNNENYSLISNITFTQTDCINITGSNITLNCNGNRIMAIYGSYGIHSFNSNNTIKNCVLINETTAMIYLSPNSNNTTVFNNTLANSTSYLDSYGIKIESSYNNISFNNIKNLTAASGSFNNIGDGYPGYDAIGIYLQNGVNNTIILNTINNLKSGDGGGTYCAAAYRVGGATGKVYGIYSNNQNFSLIASNSIYNLVGGTSGGVSPPGYNCITGSGLDTSSLHISNNINSIIYNNSIQNLTGSSIGTAGIGGGGTRSDVIGIKFIDSNLINSSLNSVSNLIQGSTTGVDSSKKYGLYVFNINNTSIYLNSIIIDGTGCYMINNNNVSSSFNSFNSNISLEISSVLSSNLISNKFNSSTYGILFDDISTPTILNNSFYSDTYYVYN
jgi:hypothetical protein